VPQLLTFPLFSLRDSHLNPTRSWEHIAWYQSSGTRAQFTHWGILMAPKKTHKPIQETMVEESLFHHSSIYDQNYTCVSYIMIVSLCIISCKNWVQPFCSTHFQSFCLSYVNLMFALELEPPAIAWYSIPKWCNPLSMLALQPSS